MKTVDALPDPTEQSIKPLLSVLRKETRSPPPIWLMRQAGRYLPEYRALRAEAGSFLDFCFTPDLAVEATLQPIKRFGLDGAILFSDILVVPHALGQRVTFVEGIGPQLVRIDDEAGVERLTIDGIGERLAPVFETLRRLHKLLPAETALIGFAGAPWTVASYMVEGRGGTDFLRAKNMAREKPVLFQRLIDLLVEATSDYLLAQVEAGAEVLQIFDSWAGALDEAQLRRWSLEPLSRIVGRLQAKHADVPVILFPRGTGAAYRDFARLPGVAGLSLDSSMLLDWAVEELQPFVALQGNLDPVLLAAGGDAMRRGALRILDTLGKGPLVFNLGHGVLPETPPEHVSELVEIVRGWHG